MADRYFADYPIVGGQVTLRGAEAHHLIHVMRAKPGEPVTLFDGSGAEFPASVVQCTRSEVELAILSRDEVDRELPLELALAVSLPKGDRQKWLLEKAVELGVTRLVPLVTSRSVVQPIEKALDRLRRGVIEASKQCGRNRLMEVSEPATWEALVEATRAVPCRLLAHPATGRPFLLHARGTLPESVLLAIGPEGGFTDEEVALAVSSGWQPVNLGPRILRVETAAIFLAAMVAAAALDQ